MYYNGVYHLFYQYNPYAATWGNISWAHSVSYNLIDWIHLEHALNPSEPYNIKGCWSGSATLLPDDHNKPVILYTGGTFSDQQVQNLATPKNLSDPFLTEWVKSSHNPLLSPVDDNIDPKFYRDPTTAWRKSDKTWRVIIGSQIDGHGAAVLYKSKDFIGWEKTDMPLHSSNKTGMWECPDFYPVRVDGSYDSETDGFSVDVDFMDERIQLRYDYGVFYASKTFYDGAKNRRILWGWVTEADSESDDIDRGWSGLQSIPRSVLLDENGKQLIQWPIEELEKLRGKNVTIVNKEIKSGGIIQADVEVSFHLPNLEDVELIDEPLVDPQLLCSQMNASVNGTFGPFGLLVLASEDLTEQTAVFFRILKNNGNYVVLMCSDQRRSSLKTHVKETIFGSFLDIDHSIVESFGGKGKSCITARVYPTLAISKNSHIYAFNNGKKSVTISNLSAWSMKKAQIAQVDRRRKPSIT
ncbi:hypothetical protein DH2020_047881 [Rehmannia glutinosa]|uniref:Uncharacterized protein n=1 Tax=Rehmannia glutinosa TaxID=99300 RepID=A0ABR0U725_REHGL